MTLFKKVLKWTAIVLVALFVIGFIWREFHYFDVKNTDAQVAKIHATKLTMDDVMGKNLPPDPGAAANTTVVGIDANNNGIRDDVELAVFKTYPNSAKTRAVLLQYALALQMEAIQPIVNKDTVIATVQEEDRANVCVADALVPRKTPESFRNSQDMEKIYNFVNFVDKLQINTTQRDNARQNFYQKIGSYNSLPRTCDIDYSTLPN